ncbi:AI-2E family transporter [Gemella cuniculi]|uniref:AI-2E family transporter n=1 Tax=Gemella cuniculi TaxID=150240 RepID=UPI000412F738|nr:AI-2E family transporter [Gemella cuniculi]
MEEKREKEKKIRIEKEKTEMSREDKLLAFLGGKFILYILIVVILLGIAIYIYTEISYIFNPINAIVSSIITPIILAYIFYYILNPLVDLFSKKMSRFIASLLAMLVGVIVILVVIIGIVPVVVEQTQNLISAMPRYIEAVRGYLDTNSDNTYVKAVNEYINTNLNTSKISSQAVTVASSAAQSIASSLSSTASVLITMPFILFFLLKDAAKFKKYIISLVPNRLKYSFDETVNEIDEKVGSYIQGQMLVSLCLGVMLFIGYNIIGLHYAFSLATIAAFLSIVPYLGPILAITPAMLVAASTSGIMVIKMLVVWGIVQFCEGNIISPNIMGRSMKMHPLTVIFVILIGVNIAGVVGAILGIPVYSILKILTIRLINMLKNRYNKYYG